MNNKKGIVDFVFVAVIIVLLLVSFFSLKSSSETTLTISDGTHLIEVMESNPNFNEFESLDHNSGLEIDGIVYTKLSQSTYTPTLAAAGCVDHSDYYENKENIDWCSMSSDELKKAFEEERNVVDRYYSDNDCGKREGDKYKYYDNYKGYSKAWYLIQSQYIDVCSGSGIKQEDFDSVVSDLKVLETKLIEQTNLHSQEVLEKQLKIDNLTNSNQELSAELSQFQREKDLMLKVQESNKQKQETLIDLSSKITSLSDENAKLKKVDLSSHNKVNGGFFEWFFNLF